MLSSREEPAPVSGLSGKNIVTISCGSSHSAAISAEGDLYTWGRGNYGQLGHGKSLPHTVFGKIEINTFVHHTYPFGW